VVATFLVDDQGRIASAGSASSTPSTICAALVEAAKPS
jgi:hypothetical protein